MKVLIDECLPEPLRSHLTGHVFQTVHSIGCKGIKDAQLLALTDHEFDVLLTGDKNLRHQQNLTTRKTSIILLPTTHWPTIKQHLSKVQQALDVVHLHNFIEVTFCQ